MECPICGVNIENGTVYFSCGPPGSQERLWARVCQYARYSGCINYNPGKPQPDDFYRPPYNLTDPEELRKQL